MATSCSFLGLGESLQTVARTDAGRAWIKRSRECPNDPCVGRSPPAIGSGLYGGLECFGQTKRDPRARVVAGRLRLGGFLGLADDDELGLAGRGGDAPVASRG